MGKEAKLRIADKTFFERSRGQLQARRADVFRAQARASSLRRVQRPSEDPVAVALQSRSRLRQRRAEAHARAAEDGIAELRAADGALGEAAELLRRARELAVQMRSDTVGVSERAAAAEEVEGLRDSLRALANTDVGGRYVFGGYEERTPPFDAAGRYVGGAGPRARQLAPDVRVPSAPTGEEVFGAAGGTDLFAALDAFAVALRADDAAGLQSALGTLEAGHEQLVRARATVGARQEAHEAARSAAEQVRDREAAEQEALVGLDPMDAFSLLQQADTALRAAVRIAARLPLPSLAEQG